MVVPPALRVVTQAVLAAGAAVHRLLGVAEVRVEATAAQPGLQSQAVPVPTAETLKVPTAL